jgi:hypothetical protein
LFLDHFRSVFSTMPAYKIICQKYKILIFLFLYMQLLNSACFFITSKVVFSCVILCRFFQLRILHYMSVLLCVFYVSYFLQFDLVVESVVPDE